MLRCFLRQLSALKTYIWRFLAGVIAFIRFLNFDFFEKKAKKLLSVAQIQESNRESKNILLSFAFFAFFAFLILYSKDNYKEESNLKAEESKKANFCFLVAFSGNLNQSIAEEFF